MIVITSTTCFSLPERFCFAGKSATGNGRLAVPPKISDSIVSIRNLHTNKAFEASKFAWPLLALVEVQFFDSSVYRL